MLPIKCVYIRTSINWWLLWCICFMSQMKL